MTSKPAPMCLPPSLSSLTDQSLFRQDAYVNGKWVQAEGGDSLQVTNPADATPIGVVPKMGSADTRLAIDAAQIALPAWRGRVAKDRSAILRRWFDLIIANTDDLALILTVEQGKPLSEARDEIRYAASFVEWFSEEAKRVYGDTIPSTVESQRIVVRKEPVGVCALITPWNFPAAMVTRKVAPALAAGCTAVLKPAEATPYTALALAVLGERAGIPTGVFNVVTGDPVAIGGELTGNAAVRKLSFTGSTPIGRLLMQQSAATLKKVSLELGGNAPFIVFEDADLDAAVAGAIAAKYRNSGQTCVSVNRFYVQSSIYNAFATKLAAAVSGLRVGAGLTEGVSQGPLINDAAVRKISSHIDDALAKGGRLLAGGKVHALGGTFFEPTVIVEAQKNMAIATEETFGPVSALFRFETDEEVIEAANDTEFGLAAYFYTQSQRRVWRVSEALEHGMVGVNTGKISSEVVPFGGIKSSGFGREGSHYGIEDYLHIKYICMGEI